MIDFSMYNDKRKLILDREVFNKSDDRTDRAFSQEFLDWADGKNIIFKSGKVKIHHLTDLTNDIFMNTASNEDILSVPEEHAVLFKLMWICHDNNF